MSQDRSQRQEVVGKMNGHRQHPFLPALLLSLPDQPTNNNQPATHSETGFSFHALSALHFAIFILLFCFRRYPTLLPFYFRYVRNRPENVFRFTFHVLKRAISFVVSLRLLSLRLPRLNFCSSSFRKTLIRARNTGAHHKKNI